MANVTIKVPDIGDFADVEIIEIHVKPGDILKVEDPLITLESDKASMDVPAPQAGRVSSVLVNIGQRISEGTEIIILDDEASPSVSTTEPSTAASTTSDSASKDTVAPALAQEPAEPPRQPPPAPPPTAATLPSFAHVHASPAVRRFARELGVDLNKVSGSGRKGRITQTDVQQYVKALLTGSTTAAASGGAGIPPIPAVDFAQFGAVQEQPLSRIQKLSGPHLHRAWLNVPMVTHHDEADITELEAFRQSLKAEAEQHGVRVTALAFIMKAVAAGLKAFPQFNASLSPDGQHLLMKQYVHIGIAVDTPNGLVVPVFRDVDQKSIYALSAELSTTSKKARDGKLSPKDMQGGCFSISSLGGIGGTGFTPIVNAPEVAILGVTRSRMQPVWDGERFVPRLMMPLDLTYDHRVIDGATGARFMVYLCQVLGDVRRLLL